MALEPITRQEKIIAGQDLTPITRMEKFLKDFGGGGGSVPKPLTYDYMPAGYPSKAMGAVAVMAEQALEFASEEGTYVAHPNETFEIVEGQTYIVTWDGAEYECVCSVYFSTILALGNKSIYGAGDDTGEPFLYISAGTFATHETAASHTISIKTIAETATPMAEEFLPVASEDNYGAVKKSEIVSAYKFPLDAPHDQMVDAIAAFKTGNASIVWHGGKLNEAYYDSSDDTITVIYAGRPMENVTYENKNGFYRQTFGKSTYRTEMILQSSTEGSTKNFKITVDDSGTISATEVT